MSLILDKLDFFLARQKIFFRMQRLYCRRKKSVEPGNGGRITFAREQNARSHIALASSAICQLKFALNFFWIFFKLRNFSKIFSPFFTSYKIFKNFFWRLKKILELPCRSLSHCPIALGLEKTWKNIAPQIKSKKNF